MPKENMRETSPDSSLHWTLDQTSSETVPCPLCEGADFTPLCSTDRYNMGIVTVGCNGCGLVLTNPQPTESALDEFYSKFYRRYYQKIVVPTLDYIQKLKKDERAAVTAAFLQSAGAIQDGNTVLDIGASEGCILKALRDQMPNLRCIAVEPNNEFSAFAKNYAGCEVFQELREVQQTNLQFDLIILNHVFEHLAHPTKYLTLLKSLLASTGMIYIDVPNLLEYTGLESLHIAHLYHFTERTLNATLRCAGFECSVMQTYSPLMHPKSIRALLQVNPIMPQPELSPLQEGWDIIRTIAADAPRYHRRRLPWYKRRIAGLRDRAASLFG